MKKSEFVDALAERAKKENQDSTKAAADFWLNQVIDLIQEQLKGGEKITLTGFGTFEVRTRAARKSVDIRSGKPIDIPEGKRPVFTAGAVLKEMVAGEKAEKKPAAKKAAPEKKPAAKKTTKKSSPAKK